MGEHGAAGQQAEAGEDRRVGLAEALECQPLLPIAFRAMGLNGDTALQGEAAKIFEESVGTATDETRGQNRLHQGLFIAAKVFHLFEEFNRAGEGRLGREVAVVVGAKRGIVHGDPADKGALTAGEADLGQGEAGLVVDRRVIDRGGGSVGEESPYQ
jgi:hypothetical protein